MGFLTFFHSLADQLANSAFRRSFLEIVEEGPNRLVLESNRGIMIVDARRKVISRSGKDLARFDQVRFIDVTREQERGECLEWRVDIYLGPLRKIRVGETRDDAQASIVGARLTSLIGAKVLAWKQNDNFRW
jgi:hypothetical protein